MKFSASIGTLILARILESDVPVIEVAKRVAARRMIQSINGERNA